MVLHTLQTSPMTSNPARPLEIISRIDLATVLRRHASTTRNPTPNQFAKNASAAYTKQKLPEYQTKPREAPQRSPQFQSKAGQGLSRASPHSSARSGQEVGRGAKAQSEGGLVFRMLTALSSTFAKQPSDAPSSSTGTYNVHAPRNARAKLRTDAEAPKYTGAAAIRMKLGYKAVARRYLTAMVATPFAIVLSWILYKRLVLGEQQKTFEKDGPPQIFRNARPASDEELESAGRKKVEKT